MSEVILEWGGDQRCFRLTFGNLLDLEEACGKVGVGEIYLRLGQHRYFARDVYHTIRQGLIGGGMKPTEADRLMQDRFDTVPMATRVELAMEILLAVMSGVEVDQTKPDGDPKEPHDPGSIFASFIKIGVTPDQIRAMDYADFVNMTRAAGGSRAQPPSEEEFEEMVARAKELGVMTGDAT